jgi:DNA processing protein
MLEARAGRGVLLPGDPPWPEGVRRLARPPLALYWLGRGSLWPLLMKRRAVAVVGTRRPSLHGLTMARRLGASLADAGWPVVSGLAEGIDGAAHEGCLERGGAPVGVLGTPLERSYPRHHAELQKRVGRQGLLVSEQAPGTSVLAAHFARRNRLQVALAAAVVVVECPLTSGALHSAELAWKEELPLWVVPADAGKASAAGSNRLLAQGATPLLTPADLIDQLGPGPLASRVPAAASMSSYSAGERAAGLREEEESGQRALLAAVGGGASLEQLSLVLGWPGPELAARLLELELAGRLCPEPGLRWRPR